MKSVYPVMYRTYYDGKCWTESYEECSSFDEGSHRDNATMKIDHINSDCLEIPILSGSLHYGVSVFEGGKAFSQPNGALKLFRPDRNAVRFHNSMGALYIPSPGEDKIIEAMCRTVGRNFTKGFFPRYDKDLEESGFFGAQSMYIRPFVVGESNLTPAICEKPTIFIICLPLGSFFGSKTITLSVSRRHRAIKGGIGWVKAASNYAISAIGRKEAQLKGYQDAVFLDQSTQTYIEECSSTNFFCVLKTGELVTPELGDTVLAGITRDSILELARDIGLHTEERQVLLQEVMEDGKECFVCGTGGGVVGVSLLEYEGNVRNFGILNKPGEITEKLGSMLRKIQFGLHEDRFGWLADPLF